MPPGPCEIPIKRLARTALLAALASLVLAVQPAEAAVGDSPWAFAGKLFNFALLAGGLFYLLRQPLARHLTSRAAGIRSALADAASTREDARRQLAEVEARLETLPREIEQLKQRGVEEIEAEKARIHRVAEADRDRLIAQARREIDLAVRLAKQELQAHVAALTVEVASERLRASMTLADQQRLIGRYVAQVKQPR